MYRRPAVFDTRGVSNLPVMGCLSNWYDQFNRSQTRTRCRAPLRNQGATDNEVWHEGHDDVTVEAVIATPSHVVRRTNSPTSGAQGRKVQWQDHAVDPARDALQYALPAPVELT